MRFAVIVFPGSNCDVDCHHVAGAVLDQEVEYVWHHEEDLSGFDCILLPGGFSYGDYLRAGAIARFSPVMRAVREAARQGKFILGICNGFQILCEAGLLPGALHRNDNLKFRCHYTHLRVENNLTPFTNLCSEGQVLRVPIAHGEGNYYADESTLRDLEEDRQIVFRYCNPDGEVTPEANPNGSVGNIAGVCNPLGNVLGMMPHPERCAEAALGETDGRIVFESVLRFWERRCSYGS